MRLRFRYVSVEYGGRPAHVDQLQRGPWSWFLPMPYAREELWRPPMDVYETDERVVVMVELAGIKEDDLEVTLFNDVLVVCGTRTDPSRPERVRYHEMGINFGRFRAEVFMPIRVKPDCVDARYENGFLSIILPRICVEQDSQQELRRIDR